MDLCVCVVTSGSSYILQVSLKAVEGFQSHGMSKFALSHWLGQSWLVHCSTSHDICLCAFNDIFMHNCRFWPLPLNIQFSTKLSLAMAKIFCYVWDQKYMWNNSISEAFCSQLFSKQQRLCTIVFRYSGLLYLLRSSMSQYCSVSSIVAETMVMCEIKLFRSNFKII